MNNTYSKSLLYPAHEHVFTPIHSAVDEFNKITFARSRLECDTGGALNESQGSENVVLTLIRFVQFFG
jgi:hypothetical protein